MKSSAMHSDQLARITPDSDGLDFKGLRQRGIALLQDLSQGRWTDYNLHDPGVTLLELLCYGLTDLLYRSQFDVPDYLVNEHGAIDYAKQALYAPQLIFPNRSVTDLDICKCIYDRIPEVEDVWIKSHQQRKQVKGLFSVYIKPFESLFQQSPSADAHPDLRDHVFALLSGQRNLGRDIAQVHIVTPQHYYLAGVIEIDDSRPRTEIYADIYFRCAQHISSANHLLRFESARQQGMPWETIFEGPLTERGFLDEAEFIQKNEDIAVVKLITLVRGIAGVVQVKSLYLVDEHGRYLSNLSVAQREQACPVLHFFDQPEKIHALDLQHGRSMALDASNSDASKSSPHPFSHREISAFGEQVRLYLKKYEFERDAFRRNQTQFDQLISLPSAEKKDLSQYQSLGENTPAIFGINHFGIPKSEPPEVHARARQLKAYLYPFEQMMANYLASLADIRHLYSLDTQVQRSYSAQFLNNDQIPLIEHLYTSKASQHETAHILREQDDFEDRRNRVLDSLLAIYGEQFPNEEFVRFDYYHKTAVRHAQIRCKIALLQHLCELSSQRSAAMNAQQCASSDQQISLQKRVHSVLGCDTQRAVSAALLQALQGDVRHISDTRYADVLRQQINVPTEIDESALTPVATPAPDDARAIFKLPHARVCDAVLQAGVHQHNYRIFKVSEQHGWLCLHTKTQRTLPLMLLPLSEVASYTQQLIQHLCDLNLSCEGFHLVEHLLLRPRGKGAQHQVHQSFYSHQVSIILPGFTARFSDLKLRHWIESLISQHLPAHLLPQFYWLDFAYLAQFEMRHQAWLEQLQDYARTGYNLDATALDERAKELLVFFKKMRGTQVERMWI